MNEQNANALLGLLERHSKGVTAKVAARELGWKETAASLRLGRLASAGTIARTSPPGRLNNLFLYFAKQIAAPLAPAEPVWAPARTIIAQRRTDRIHEALHD